MKRKHHNAIVDENYQDKIVGEHERVGKSRHKTKKHKRPSSSMLLKSSIRKYLIEEDLYN